MGGTEIVVIEHKTNILTTYEGSKVWYFLTAGKKTHKHSRTHIGGRTVIND